MKNGETVTPVQFDLLGYEILCKFGCGFVWKKKDGTGRRILWEQKTQTITLIYGDDERYATASL